VKIGILGGGQLARMIMEECYKFDFEFVVLSKTPSSPAGMLTKDEMVGDWNDEAVLREFADSCDIVTLENEFIDYKKIEFIESLGKTVHPSSKIIQLIQDKLIQKQTLKDLGIPSAEFVPVKTIADIKSFAETHGYPLILKSRTMGYDGKGNYKLDSADDIDKALETIGTRGELMCESFINFKTEIAIQAARSPNGEIKIYPVVETIQKNHICHIVKASEKKFTELKDEVNDIATKILKKLDYVGVMGIEMFLMEDNSILVNELAPRVHNTGHYTIEGCYTSQFENHIRAVLDLPLGDISMREDAAVMINIIGEKDAPAKVSRLGAVLQNYRVYVHIYGKQETRIGRKMGHITVLDKYVDIAEEVALKCRDLIGI
jgi:5-(carboxyamino)imidazole ribonucleotide synthase